MTVLADAAWKAAADIWDSAVYQSTPGGLAAKLTEGRELEAPHLAMIDQAYRDLEAGVHNRVMIFAPPRHGKSQRAARWGPLWWLQRHHDARIAIASYSSDLAEGHSRWMRDTIANSPALGLELSPGSRAVKRWDLNRTKGGLIAVGVGSGFTGKGADLLVVDDPVADAQAADSPTVREATWAWWQSVAETRLEPDGKVLLIQTRWHEDDLAGRLLADFAAEWHVLNMPALAEDDDILGRKPGEALWPVRYDESALKDIRAHGGRWWGALYQQRPVPPEGAIWRRPWIGHVVEGDLPMQFSKVIVGVDPAVTSSASSDETGIVVVAIDQDGHGYVLDDCSLRGTPSEWADAVWDAFIEWNATEVVMEGPPLWESGVSILRSNWTRAAQRHRITRPPQSLPIRAVPCTGGKRLRAEPISTLYEQGMISHYGKHVELEEQMLNWAGTGKSPDRLDAMVHGFTGLFLDHGKRNVIIGQRWAGGRQ